MAYGPSANIFWEWIGLGSVLRPSRMTPPDQKDEEYDARCTRYYLGSVHRPYRDFYLRNYVDNLRYAIGGPDSWGDAQDIREFLGTKTEPTGRLALKNFVLQPMHTRLIGAADNISIEAHANAITQFAKTRKEAALAQKLLFSQAAQQGPMMADAYAPMGITPDEGQTEDDHENSYQDEYVKAMNSLLEMMGQHQKLDKKKRQAASYLALSGMFAIHGFPNGNHIEAELVRPDEVGWDTTATKSDMSDGEFWYIAPLMDISQIAERYQTSQDRLKQLERWTNVSSEGMGAGANTGLYSRKLRVMTTYFKDLRFVDRGYVMKDGEPYYTTINEPNMDSRKDDPIYTDKDLVKPPDNSFTVTWTDAEFKAKKQTRAIQSLRYCTMIPWEYLPGPFNEGLPYAKRNGLQKDTALKLGLLGPTGDFILESGEYPLQEVDPDQIYQVEPPLKIATWSYMSGTVIAPLSAARDPQRMMNMVVSDIVYRMERAGIPAVGLDSDATAGAGNKQADIIRALKEGKPYFLKGTLVGGIQNAVTVTDTSTSASFYAQWQILDHLYQMAQNATGIYDQNFGAPSDPKQLVGNKKLQLQQAGVMQQPFYAALADGFEQINQFNAQAGKRFYSARPWALKQMVGDDGANAIQLSVLEDLDSEQFRVVIELTVDSDTRKDEADNMMFQQGGLMDRGMLDQAAAADLMGRSYKSDLGEAARKYTKQMAKQAQAQQQAQQQQAQQMQAQQQQQGLQAQQAQLDKQHTLADIEKQKSQTKMAMPGVQEQAKWLAPGAANQAMPQDQQNPVTP